MNPSLYLQSKHVPKNIPIQNYYTLTLTCITHYIATLLHAGPSTLTHLHSLHHPFQLGLHLRWNKTKQTTTTKKTKTKQTSNKKVFNWKQAHVGMEPSKTNQTRWEQHHNTFTPSLHLVPFCQPCTPQTLHTPATPTSQQTTLLPATSHLPHNTTSNTLTYHKVWTNTLLLIPQPSTYNTPLTCHAQQLQKPTGHTTHPNMPHRPSTHLAPHSAYILH